MARRTALPALLPLLLSACTVSDKIAAGDAGLDDVFDAATPSDAGADLDAPQTEMLEGPDPISRDTTPTFRFAASEPATFMCSVDGESPLPCETPYTRSLGDGPHTFTVRAIDLDGNADDSPAEQVWTIDTVAPDTQLTKVPPASDNSVIVHFGFTSPETSVTFDCALDGSSYLPCASGDAHGPLGDGVHSFAVRAHDRAGNLDSSPAIYAWSIDSSTPDTQIVSGPAGPVDSSTVSFTFTSADAGGGATFQCALDGSAFVACASPHDLVDLAEGAHLFAVRVRDAVGNLDPTPATRSWSVDRTAPDTTITMGPSGAVPLASASLSFVSDDPSPVFACSLDEAEYEACTSPLVIGGLAQGPHQVWVRAIDLAGHVDPTPATRAWIVDTIAPDTSIDAGPTGTVTTRNATFDWNASEEGVTFVCSLDDAAFAPCSDPAAFTVDDGAHTVAVSAVDTAGNLDASPATAAWTVDATGPTVAITAGPASGATVGPYVTFGFTTSDGALTCSLDGGVFVACASPVVLSLPAGAHGFSVRATDEVGNPATVTRSFTVACGAPASASGSRGLFHLDDGAGSSVASNSVAAGASASLGANTSAEPTDPAWIAGGRFGGALAFDGASGQHLTWPSGLGGIDDLTIELWARPAALGGSHDLLVSSDGRIAVRVVGGAEVQIAVSIARSNGTVYTVTSAAVAANQWHHVIASIDEPTLRLWVDGVRVELGGVNLGGSPDLGTVTIGAATTAYTGDLDEVHVSTTALTSDDQALPRYCPL